MMRPWPHDRALFFRIPNALSLAPSSAAPTPATAHSLIHSFRPVPRNEVLEMHC